MVLRHSLFPLCLALGLVGCAKPSSTGDSLNALDNELLNSVTADDLQAATAKGAGSALPRSAWAAGDCHAGGRSGHCTAAETVNAPGCSKRFALGLSWATRLPPGLELYPGAKVIEAAGSDDGDCRMRIVSYVSDASVKELVAWYEAAAKVGYETEHVRDGGEDVVAGTRQPQGDAFQATIAPDAAGSTVNLIVNHGS